jgi:hypothetical protein
LDSLKYSNSFFFDSGTTYGMCVVVFYFVVVLNSYLCNLRVGILSFKFESDTNLVTASIEVLAID